MVIRVKCGMPFGNIASSEPFTINNTEEKNHRMLYGSVHLLYIYVCADCIYVTLAWKLCHWWDTVHFKKH